MVKKLFKHEFLSLFRLMFPIECAVLGAGILVRFMNLFETKSIWFESITASSVLIMVAALLAGNVSAIVFGIIRYYKNLFSTEGYLSFTLPVTPAQHIFVKAITITAVEIIAGVVAVISFCIATAGDLLEEIGNLISYLLKMAFTELKPVHLILFMIELVVLLVIKTISQYLLYYACITIGQLAHKHKVLLAFGVFGIYAVISSVASVFINVFAGNLLATTNLYEKIVQIFAKNPYTFIHIAFVISLVSYLLVSAIYFLISNIIIKKKLNLE